MDDFVDMNVSYNDSLDVSIDIDAFLECLTPEQWTYILEWILEDLSENDIKSLKEAGYEVTEKE